MSRIFGEILKKKNSCDIFRVIASLQVCKRDISESIVAKGLKKLLSAYRV